MLRDFRQCKRRAGIELLSILIVHALLAAFVEWFLFRHLVAPEPFYWQQSVRQFAFICGLEAAVLLACLPVRVVERSTGGGTGLTRGVATAGFGLLTIGLFSLYAANFASLLYLHSTLDRSIAVLTIEALPEIRATQPLTFASAVAGASLVAAAIFFLYWRACRRVPATIDFLAAALSSPGRQRYDFAAAAAILVFCAGGIGSWSYLLVRPEAWYNDTLRTATLPDPQAQLGITLSRSPTPLAPATPRDVIVILADSLRADHFPHYGYERMTTPFLAELAKSGKLWKADWAVSTCSETPCGVLATLLSRRMGQAVGRSNVALHTVLKDAGYDVDFLLSGSHLSQVVLKAVYGDRSMFNTLMDGESSGGGNDDRRLIEATDRLPPAGRKPRFLLYFLMSTHFTGQKQPEHRTWQPELSLFAAGARNLGSRGTDPLSPEEHQAAVNTYDNGLRQMDDTLRRIFERLDAKGYLDNALVLIASDHAEALGEHGMYVHGAHLYPEFLRIPLFIYDRSGRTYPPIPLASQVDIAATAAAAAGLPIPPSWEGIDLQGPVQRRVAFAQNTRLHEIPCRGVFQRPASTLYYLMACRGGREELYDLGADSLGSRNIRDGADPALLGDMRRELREAFPDFSNIY
jgi:hypothetical protein